MPYTTAFPHALGTGIVVQHEQPIDSDLRRSLDEFIAQYEQTLSCFRDDSLVTAMGRVSHGGSFDFGDWALPLFELYDRLDDLSQGTIDPCIGEDLIRLGYGADMRFTVEADAGSHLGSLHGRATWARDVGRHGTTLVTTRPVHLDFGACGKGYLVDLLARMLTPDESDSPSRLVIDAGGDLFLRTGQPVSIALEDPSNTANAVGTATVTGDGAFCASAPSRRRWGAMHHLLNAIDGLPVNRVSATWVSVPAAVPYPTAAADGLATALFVTDPSRLAGAFDFECALLYAGNRAAVSSHFPGSFFSAQP